MSGDKPMEADVQLAPDTAWGVVCLCAAWCGVCRQYEPEFRALQAKFPQVRFDWLDVEDEEELMGDIDVETFPTLLIGNAQGVQFLGPLLPQIKVLDRLLASLLTGQPATADTSTEAQALWERVAGQWQ